MIIKLTQSGAVAYSIEQLKADNSNVSFPAVMSESLLAEYSVAECTLSPRPEYDQTTHRIEKSAQPYQTNGVWTWGWDIVELSQEQKAKNIRDQRTMLLKETDWWAVQDRTMSQAEKDYRQALRDITDQPTFPDSVVWPTEA